MVLLAGQGRGDDKEEAALPPWGQTLEDTNGAAGGPRRAFRHLLEEPEGTEAGPRFWVRPELLLGWIRSERIPALATRGSPTDARPGALDSPFTRVIYGGDIDYEDRRGFGVNLGAALSDDGALAVDGSYFFLTGRQPRFQAESPGQPVLARPFVDAETGQLDSSLTTYPGLVTGRLDVVSDSFLHGFEANASTGTDLGENVRVRGLAGLRYVNLHEGLAIRESSTVVATGHPLEGQTIRVQDVFRTSNDFFGGQVGAQTSLHFRRFSADLFGKVALGSMNQRATIQGGTDLAGQPVAGGLLAVASNSKTTSRSSFGYVPEAGARLETTIGRHLSLHCGYSFLLLGSVMRPGDLVDPAVNLRLVPTSTTFGTAGGPARPAARVEETDFWAHLFQFGVTVRY